MKEYRFQWQTWIGISLLILLLTTVFLPELYVRNEEEHTISRLTFAKWTLTVDQDYDFTRIQTQDGNLLNDEKVVPILRMWGWLICIPFFTVLVSIVFVVVSRQTLSGLLLATGLVTMVCECMEQFIVPAMLWKDNKNTFAVFVGVIILSTLLIIHSILCMTVWKLKKTGNIKSNTYNYVFQENQEIWNNAEPVKKTSVRAVGILKGIRGEYAGQSLEIHAGEEIILGRDPQYCMLIFSNPRVSRRQCGIRYDAVNGFYQAIDYSSSGTTLSDGTLLTTSEYTPLQPGTVLYIANGSEALALL